MHDRGRRSGELDRKREGETRNAGKKSEVKTRQREERGKGGGGRQ